MLGCRRIIRFNQQRENSVLEAGRSTQAPGQIERMLGVLEDMKKDSTALFVGRDWRGKLRKQTTKHKMNHGKNFSVVRILIYPKNTKKVWVSCQKWKIKIGLHK